MKVLVACEESQTVCKAFRKRGHEAYSCDIQECSGGHPTSKKTGLWLKGLPKLFPTNIVEQEFHISGTGRKWDKWFWESSLIHPLSERSKFRSKTFEGIAKAMAEQWG